VARVRTLVSLHGGLPAQVRPMPSVRPPSEEPPPSPGAEPWDVPPADISLQSISTPSTQSIELSNLSGTLFPQSQSQASHHELLPPPVMPCPPVAQNRKVGDHEVVTEGLSLFVQSYGSSGAPGATDPADAFWTADDQSDGKVDEDAELSAGEDGRCRATATLETL